jgi:hypothetical protein
MGYRKLSYIGFNSFRLIDSYINRAQDTDRERERCRERDVERGRERERDPQVKTNLCRERHTEVVQLDKEGT